MNLLQRPVSAAVASALGCVVLLVAGCSGTTRVPSLGYAVDAVIATYNGSTSVGAATGTDAVFERVLTGFFYTGPDGQPIADTDVGTAKEVPGDAQTIEYRLNPKGVYSDGVPTTCDDLVFTWVARSGRFPNFDTASTVGYRDIDRVDCEPGSKDAKVTFKRGVHYQPWRTLFSAGELMPAHIAAQNVGIDDVVHVMQNGDSGIMGKLADFWNTGWSLAPGKVDIAKVPSSGPYRIESFTENGGLVLVTNEKWWGEKPATGRIVVWPKTKDLGSHIGKGEVAVVDIGAGSVPDADLKALHGTTVASHGIEQLVLSTGGVLGSVAVRKALASCVPRKDIFQQLGKIDQPPAAGLGSGPVNTHVIGSDSVFYAAAASAGDHFAGGDATGARAALDSGGVRNPTIRIGYRTPDARRARTVAMITDSCKAAGMTIVDAGSPDFLPSALRAGQVDALLSSTGGAVGPAGDSSGLTASNALHTGSGTNFGSFANKRFDTIADQLASTSDSPDEMALRTESERLLWDQVPSIPLMATPRTIAFAGGVRHGVPGPTRAGTGWNMDRWVLER